LNFLKDAEAVEPKVISLRRYFHQHPELSYMEEQTARRVAEELRSLGIEVRTGVGGNGVVGILRGKKSGKVVALRADMDALPVEELSDVPFRSKNRGVMHACGHDTHIAMLLGAAEVLSSKRSLLSGTIKFIFQPAEEHGGRGGAKPMIEAGVMRDPKVDYVFGLHISDREKSGVIATKPGPFMAAPDSFKITVKGRGGHGSAPHQTVDPIYIAASVIIGLQGVSGRMIDPVEPFVISVCSIHSGTKDNIIPDEATLEGTIRTLDEETREVAKRQVRKVAESICETFGAACSVEFMPDAYPVTYNDPKTTMRAMEILSKIPGVKVQEAKPILGGEDFSRFLQEAPGTFYFLGTHNEAKGCIYPNHSSRFKVDEAVLKYGVASLATLAYEFTRA
jgi:carboxypeptidase Ss1